MARRDLLLSTGRTVAHRPYLSAGKPNGATQVYILDAAFGCMTDAEWQEYVERILETYAKES